MELTTSEVHELWVACGKPSTWPAHPGMGGRGLTPRTQQLSRGQALLACRVRPEEAEDASTDWARPQRSRHAAKESLEQQGLSAGAGPAASDQEVDDFFG